MNTSQLTNDIKQCTLCEPSLTLGARPIIQINESAKILIASQAPGRKAHISGIPFNDPSGVRLREWLNVTEEVFYDSTIFSIVPMGFCYPGKAKTGDMPPRPECAKTWRERTLNSMPNIELILAIGQYAQKYHLVNKKDTLTATVKNWREYHPQIIPLPHPSPLNNIWLKRNPWFCEDLLPELKKRVAQLIAL